MNTFMSPTGTLVSYLPSLMAPPAVLVFPSTGTKLIEPSATGTPLNLTAPFTVTELSPSQPTTKSVTTRKPLSQVARSLGMVMLREVEDMLQNETIPWGRRG